MFRHSGKICCSKCSIEEADLEMDVGDDMAHMLGCLLLCAMSGHVLLQLMQRIGQISWMTWLIKCIVILYAILSSCPAFEADLEVDVGDDVALAGAVAAGGNKVRPCVHASQASSVRRQAGLLGEACAGVQEHHLAAGHARGYKPPAYAALQLLHPTRYLALPSQ